VRKQSSRWFTFYFCGCGARQIKLLWGVGDTRNNQSRILNIALLVACRSRHMGLVDEDTVFEPFLSRK